MAERYVKLGDKAHVYRDSDTRGLTLVKGQVKPLEEPVSAQTKRWLNAGGLILCDRRGNPIRETGAIAKRQAQRPVPPPVPSDATDASADSSVPSGIEERVEELIGSARSALVSLAAKVGLPVAPKENKRSIATRIAERELGS